MIRVAPLTGPDLGQALDALARLRIRVFRDWPYLYDGDLDYETAYLAPYRDSDRAIVVGAWQGRDLVGAATGTPMADHAQDFAAPLAACGIPLDDIFYCAESLLLPQCRGQGIGHRFFDLREAHARRLGFGHAAFCSVVRPADHPMRPAAYRPLDTFWRKRGYAPLPGALARFSWRDLGQTEQSAKPLQVWIRRLDAPPGPGPFRETAETP